jgi:hypothetical protein
MSLERTYKSLERNRASVDRHEFLLLMAADDVQILLSSARVACSIMHASGRSYP